jgi:hypothetical protein
MASRDSAAKRGGRLRFNDDARRDLQARYLAVGGREWRASEFVDDLERSAQFARWLDTNELGEQDARREAITKLAGALRMLAKAVNSLDRAALAHVIAIAEDAHSLDA